VAVEAKIRAREVVSDERIPPAGVVSDPEQRGLAGDLQHVLGPGDPQGREGSAQPAAHMPEKPGLEERRFCGGNHPVSEVFR
jgi:hypothetical protein